MNPSLLDLPHPSLRRLTEMSVVLIELELLTAVNKIDRNALRKKGCKNPCLDNHYPRGEGLATSPHHRARLRFQRPNFRV